MRQNEKASTEDETFADFRIQLLAIIAFFVLPVIGGIFAEWVATL